MEHVLVLFVFMFCFLRTLIESQQEDTAVIKATRSRNTELLIIAVTAGVRNLGFSANSDDGPL